MPRLYYHPGSDALWVEQYEYIDWSHLPGEEVDDVSMDPAMVERYNREVPGYKVHLMQDREDGLGFCLICRAGECELTTDCPGEPQPEYRRVATCAGFSDFWSGVWL